MVRSKQHIGVLIALMSVALIGVMVIQFLWISNAIRLKRDEFNQHVNDAMLGISTSLEGIYGVNFLTQKLKDDSFARSAVIKNDPGFYKFMVDVCRTDEENSGTWVTQTVEIRGPEISSSSISFKEGEQQEKTVTLENVNNDKHERVMVSRTFANKAPMGPDPPPSPPFVPEAPDSIEIRTKKERLINIMTNVADEYAISKMNMLDVLDSSQVCGTIAKEFERQHLPKNFEFAVYCNQGDTLMINKAASTRPLEYFTYKASLLPTEYMDAKTTLLINIPDRARFIFAQVAGMLALSIMFTLFIVAAFGYSLHVIFRQKKLSEITNDFINNMTHELKTPLATISMAADTINLPDVKNDPERLSEYAGLIKHEVKKSSRHVDRILEAAVSERGEYNYDKEKIDLKHLINEEVKNFEPQVLQKGGSIKATLPDQDVFISANNDSFRDVLCNLLDNALKYSAHNPEIKIELSRAGKNILLTVSDKGIGISKADQKMVFEKFYRAHTGNLHDVKGFGLGLSFVKGVVESVGGRVWIESELNKGSKFFIELPLIDN